MVLNLFATLLVIGAAFVNSLFGLYSGVVNCLCAVISLAVAFGFWEVLNDVLTGTLNLHASYTAPLSLGLLFAISLTVLRFTADNMLRGNVRVPMYVDWVGGGVFGFFYAQICVGVLVIAFLMLPWGGRIMMYEVVERSPEGVADDGRTPFRRNHLWLRSDEFAASLAKMLSGGSLRTSTTMASVYPDLVLWVGWTGNQVQSESITAPMRDGKTDGWGEKGLSVVSWWEQKAPLPADSTRYRKEEPTRERDKPPYEPKGLQPGDGKRLIGVRIGLKDAAADKSKDASYHRFRPTNIRIVGDVTLPDGSKKPMQLPAAALGGADASLDTNIRIADPDNNFSVPARGETKIDVFFETPEGFTPRFIEYRRFARIAVAGAPAENPPGDRLSIAAPADPKGGGKPGSPGPAGGAARFVDAIDRSGSGDVDRLPFKITASRLASNLDVTTEGNMLVSVAAKQRLSGLREDLEQKGGGAAIDRLKIPEGKRIFQAKMSTRKAQSIPGQAINFASSTVAQFKAVDDKGNSHDLAGYYAIVKQDGKEFLEFYFTPNPSDDGFSGLLEFSTETRTALRQQNDAVLGLIFVVPPGTCISAIQSQGGRSDLGSGFCVRGK